jgi:hypothetical protein
MDLQIIIRDIWIAGTGVQALLALVLLLKKSWRRYPAFSAYTFFCVLESAALYPLYNHRWYLAYFRAFWICEAISIFLGLIVVREIFTNVFAAHAALRKLATIIFRLSVTTLAGLACFVVVGQWMDAAHGMAKSILLANEAARLIELGLIVFLFLSASVFGLHWRQSIFGIALGLGMIVAFELAHMTLIWHVSKTMGDALSVAKGIAYLGSVLIWLGYLTAPERLTSRADVPRQDQLEQWNQAVAELISQ